MAAWKPAPLLARVALVLSLLVASLGGQAQSRDTLPASLSDADFWALSERISEPGGYFRSNSGSTDNLLSNEQNVSTVAAELASRVRSGGVYLGVGPEQNFSYIVAMRPRIAFITDIRRGNLQLHLVYKALFETTSNRAEFVSRLFSRTRPSGLTTQSSAEDLMSAFLRATPVSEAAFNANLKAIYDHLKTTRHLPLTDDDVEGIEYVYRNFYRFGPAIHYTSSIGGSPRMNNYASIMASTDMRGAERTYLASEENFAFVKGLETKNLIVPLVGDFAGPKALRTLGSYLRERGATVTAFYVSNVEMYLQRNGVWQTFCANVATMPLDAASVFIRPGGRMSASPFSPMAQETASCRAGMPRDLRRPAR